MSAPTRWLWELAGRPEPRDESAAAKLADHPAVCRMCGEHADRTATVKAALGDNWTDQTVWRDQSSNRVCTGCVWVCSGKGKTSLRTWTVVAATGMVLPDPPETCTIPTGSDWSLTNRGNPRPVLDVLLDPPPGGQWLVSVATSGQKHLLPYATVNHGGDDAWTVRLESTNVTSTAGEFAGVLQAAATLRVRGHRGDDIRTGTPTMSAIKSGIDADTWKTVADRLAAYAGSPLLDLALWCLTKETIHDHD